MATKAELRDLVKSISDDEIQSELEKLSKNPKNLQKDVGQVVDNLSEDDVRSGAEAYGSVEKFLEAIVFFIAIKATLIRKGLKVGVAAGAGAALLFGAGALGHSVATATGVGAIEELACGLDCAGDLALDVSDAGFAVAESGFGFFGELLEGVFSLF